MMMLVKLYCRDPWKDPRTDPRGIAGVMHINIMYIMHIVRGSKVKKSMGDIIGGVIRADARYYVPRGISRFRNASTLLSIIGNKALLRNQGINIRGALR